MTSRSSLAAIAATLRAAGIADAAREARWLAAEAGQDPGALAGLVARRAAREPLAYILGDAPFRALTLAVSPATLIPRADTETLIEAALDARPDRAAIRRILDLGTGTGCLLLAALAEYRSAWGLGIDRVPAACALAAANAAANGLADRCALLCADWAAPLAPPGAARRFDLVLANPPYIPTRQIASLMPEVARHEPRSALDGGADGLDAYRTLVACLRPLLAPGGIAMFELGAGQSAAVEPLARACGWQTALRQDRGGHDRVLILRPPSADSGPDR